MTWDLLAVILVVVAAIWLLRWNARRGTACASCPATADVRRDRALAQTGTPAVCCKSPDQLAIGRANTASAADKAASGVPPVS